LIFYYRIDITSLEKWENLLSDGEFIMFHVFGNVNFDFERYFSLLNTNLLGKKLIYFERVTSTNDVAKKYAKLGEWGLCILAEEQTEGRGTHGRRWVTYRGNSIALSIILHPDWIKNVEVVSILISRIIVETLEKFNVFADIKFPNDVYLNGKKIAGVLTETFYYLGKLQCVVLGIGINLNQEEFDDTLKNIATSVKLETGIYLKREEFLALLLNELDTAFLN